MSLKHLSLNRTCVTSRHPHTHLTSKSVSYRLKSLPDNSENIPSTSGRLEDPFISAAVRLQKLVRSCGSPEDEIVDLVITNESPDAKLQYSLTVAAIVATMSIVISTLCSKDPWGGMSWSLDTAKWMAVGGLCAIPLVAWRAWSWSAPAYKAMPVMEDIHLTQLQVTRPYLMGVSRGQAALIMVLETLPLILLMLPAAQGVFEASSSMYSHLLHPNVFEDLGATSETVPHSNLFLIHALGLSVTAGLSALGKALELSMDIEEFEVVNAAVDNADRYYRVTAMDMTSRGTDAEHAAAAFKAVAKVYLMTRSKLSVVAGALCFIDVTYLGALWFLSGNLAVPLVVALTANWVDVNYLYESLYVKDKVAKGSGSGSSKA
ncbi:hypothetical protein CEUSTIGMA_g8179.t1 [Chlamydomonas eustigma]|uniref:Uncharacterized protein n=1 Tax=Chlamydomonas eustigma TaxID=1157962 RepID=A0A250XCD6_9CHLO|nr:hypothetical protein CEUSTIGMA_g8179.t1 [Chlamydomonas eustigma]|eukprot:GAX80744.1 hypothetical protein CEUSTIGMA_g8179.t1 [Chlamydomonas eustigma]